MSTYHLKAWSKRAGRTSNPFIAALEITRLYLNADDRSSLGYIERRTTAGERGSETYYDRHRATKGDTADVTSDVITCTIPADAFATLIAAVSGNIGRDLTASDDMGRFLTLQEFARGIKIIPYHPAKSAAGRAERKKLKERQAFTVEI